MTTRNLRAVITDLTDESRCAFAGLAVYPQQQGYRLKLMPVLEGEWFFSEERLLYTCHPAVKTLTSSRAVLNFACRYGIDARRVRFMEESL